MPESPLSCSSAIPACGSYLLYGQEVDGSISPEVGDQGPVRAAVRSASSGIPENRSMVVILAAPSPKARAAGEVWAETRATARNAKIVETNSVKSFSINKTQKKRTQNEPNSEHKMRDSEQISRAFPWLQRRTLGAATRRSAHMKSREQSQNVYENKGKWHSERPQTNWILHASATLPAESCNSQSPVRVQSTPLFPRDVHQGIIKPH